MELERYIGQVLDDRYKIIKVIGKGGMAIVFEALDLVMKRVVALKVLKDDIAKDPQSVKRFINESKAISMLSHPNIVSIYDISIKGDLKYIVMERVEGITLKNYINRKGVLSEREALVYTQQILKALEHAHSKGIIHRDIKPQNIMLLKNGVIKVTDFGIAKLPNAETLTVADKAIGTVYYISPEQAGGKAIDPRSDLYSLGIVMYEMLTGCLPFTADTPVSVALKQINEQPEPPRDKISKLSVGVEQIILTAMEKNPDKRFQDAAIMRKHVEQMLANPGYVFSNRKMSAIPAAKGLKGVVAKMAKKKKPKPKRRNSSMLPVIAGICFAIVIILAVSLVSIVIDLFKDDTVKSTIIVDNYINELYTDDLKLELEGMGYNVIVEYTDNSNYEPYTIVRQKPVAGSKKAYIEGKTKVDITFTICRDKNSMTMQLPDYKMKDYRTVEINAEGIGLKTTVKFESHDLIPEGMVLRTDPVAGEIVTKGTLITLYVSQGPDLKMAKMPKLVGKTVEQAQQLLRSFQLNLGEPTYMESDRPKGEILEQSVAEGVEIATGSEVFVIVSSGPAETTAPDDGTVVIPSVKGKKAADAWAALAAVELKYSTESDYSDTVAAGLVIKTFPAEGEKIRKGETVTVYVSNGKKPETTPETKPPETLPAVTEPVVTEPVQTEPVVTQPVQTQPVVTQPVVTQPEQTQPEQTQASQTQPEQTAAGSP